MNWRFFLRWTCIGLLLRFVLMPFTLHALDLFFIHYLPFLTGYLPHGTDPYQWFKDQFPHCDTFPAYPVGAVYFSIFFQKVLQPFFIQLPEMMRTFQEIAFRQGGSNVHFASALQGPYLYRTLFLLKAPYLIFDFATVFMLLEFCQKEKAKVWIYRFWMLNPIALHTSYGVGQIDGVIAFFLVFSCWLLRRSRLKLGMFFLGVGGLIKLAPLLVVPPLSLALKKRWPERFQLLGAAILPVALVVLLSRNPTGAAHSLTSWATLYWEVIQSVSPFLLLGIGYVWFLWLFVRGKELSSQRISLLFCLFLLVFWGTISLRPRHLLWCLPFLITAIAEQPYLLGWVVSLLIAIWELHAPGINSQLGIFSPIEPIFFSSLPIWDSFMALVMDVRWLQRFCRIWLVIAVGVIIVFMVKKCSSHEKKLLKWSKGLAFFWILSPVIGVLVVLLTAGPKIPSFRDQLMFKDIGAWNHPASWTKLGASNAISQEFLCNFNSLSRVGVYVKRTGDRSRTKLQWELKEIPGGETIRSAMVSGEAVRWTPHDFYAIPPDPHGTGWFRFYFDFEPVEGSAGKTYSFTLRAPSQEAISDIEIGVVSDFYYHALKQGKYYEKGQNLPNRTLAFVTFCRYQEDPAQIPQKLHEKLQQDTPFYLFYGGSLMLFLSGIMISLRRRDKCNIVS